MRKCHFEIQNICDLKFNKVANPNNQESVTCKANWTSGVPEGLNELLFWDKNATFSDLTQIDKWMVFKTKKAQRVVPKEHNCNNCSLIIRANCQSEGSSSFKSKCHSFKADALMARLGNFKQLILINDEIKRAFHNILGLTCFFKQSRFTCIRFWDECLTNSESREVLES